MIKFIKRKNKMKAHKVVGDLVEKNIKIGTVMIRAAHIMETLAGLLILAL